MKVVSLCSGAGGCDLGFKLAGFEIVAAQESDKVSWKTFQANFPEVPLLQCDLEHLHAQDLPECDGIIGGPLCPSWSTSRSNPSQKGNLKGEKEFREYLRIIREVQPKFFLWENANGNLARSQSTSLDFVVNELESLGYKVEVISLNANDYNVPQDRRRIYFIGFRQDLPVNFKAPEPYKYNPTLKDAIADIEHEAVCSRFKNKTNGADCLIENHEYFVGPYSAMFLSRNRVRGWDEPGFTVQPSGRLCQIHPKAPPMVRESKDHYVFAPGFEHLYRRLTVRECARLQTFPDSFVFVYASLQDGYKMIGEAIPVNLAKVLGETIKASLQTSEVSA